MSVYWSVRRNNGHVYHGKAATYEEARTQCQVYEDARLFDARRSRAGQGKDLKKRNNDALSFTPQGEGVHVAYSSVTIRYEIREPEKGTTAFSPADERRIPTPLPPVTTRDVEEDEYRAQERREHEEALKRPTSKEAHRLIHRRY